MELADVHPLLVADTHIADELYNFRHTPAYIELCKDEYNEDSYLTLNSSTDHSNIINELKHIVDNITEVIFYYEWSEYYKDQNLPKTSKCYLVAKWSDDSYVYIDLEWKLISIREQYQGNINFTETQPSLNEVKTQIKNDKIKNLEKFLKANPNIQLNRLFQQACNQGDLDLVEYLWQTYKNFTLDLDLTCCYGHLEVVKFLIRLIPFSNISSQSFLNACYSGNVDLVKYLIYLDKTINVHVYEEQAFRYACTNGNLELVIYLIGLNRKINVNICDNWGLRMAHYNQHSHIVDYLCKRDSKLVKVVESL